MGLFISRILSTPTGYQNPTNALHLNVLHPSTPSSTMVNQVTLNSCQCSTAGMDPLVAAGFHNLTCSPLCRLPEELLIDIMERLSDDLLTIQCLRRASRLFLRLYSSPTFSNSHGTGERRECFDHWMDSRNDLPNNGWARGLQAFLDKDSTNYCSDCQRIRTDHHTWNKKITALTREYLHCSGCRIEHPVCLFSKAQRSKSPLFRICIGREGFVRVCEHLVVTWDEVISSARELSVLNSKLATVVLKKCEHEHKRHFPKHHKNDTSLTSSQNVYPAIELKGCRTEYTWVKLLWHGHLYLPDISYDEDGYNKILGTPSLFGRQLEEFRQDTPAEYIAPEFSPGRLLEMGMFDPNRCSCVRYAGIERLPKGWRLTTRDSEFLACRRDARNRLNALRSSRTDKEINRRDEQKHLQDERREGLQDGQQGDRQDEQQEDLQEEREEGLQDEQRGDLQDDKREDRRGGEQEDLQDEQQKDHQDGQQEDLQGEQERIESHKAEMQTTGTIVHGSSRVAVHIEPCPAEKRCLQILYQRWVNVIPGFRPNTDYVTWGWCQAVDPDSYNLTDDKESFGVLWCRQQGCHNYYKYIRRAPFGLGGIHRQSTGSWR